MDGRLRGPEASGVSPMDRGFALGDGLFETLRVYEGRPFQLAAHLRRLEEGLERMGLHRPAELVLPWVREGIDAVLREPEAANEALRISVTRGPGAPGLRPPPDPEPTVVVSAVGYEPELAWYRDGLSAAITGGRVNEGALSAGLKQLGYLEFVMAREEAARRGAQDALLLNAQGHLAEGSASNLFVVRGDIVRTPGLEEGVLPGVTRAVVLELARRQDIPVREEPLPRSVLQDATEVFLTSSLRELVPVVEVDGRPVGDGRPGPVWRHLSQLYRQKVAWEAASAPGNEP